MLTVNKYKDVLLDEFYLDSDDITIRRNKDGWRGKWSKHDIVKGYKLCKHGYIGIHIPKTRTSVNAAHLITILRGIDIPDTAVIDHLDGDGSNNSRENLRITTQAVNCRNRVKNVNNTTGFTGISWNKSTGSYTVRRTINRKRIYLGLAKTLDEAIRLFNTLDQESLLSGYTKRHGK